jgi:hypothetical protein
LGGVYVRELMEKGRWQRTAQNKELVFKVLAKSKKLLLFDAC